MADEQDKIFKDEPSLRDFVPYALVVIIIVIFYAAAIVIVSWPITFANIDKAGVFGDSFGVLTACFSGLAFAGIVYTMFLQMKELGYQRKELKFTHDELTLTRKEFEKQNIAAKLQNFESTFFQMLRLHNDIVGSLDLRWQGQDREIGRSYFSYIYNRLKTKYEKRVSSGAPGSYANQIEVAVHEIWNEYRRDLGPYYRYLFTIFNFVVENDVVDKRQYADIVRAQLSDYELLILFYLVMHKYGIEKFKSIVEDFAIFENLPQELLCSASDMDFYHPKAFGPVDGS